jgi:hypothetical protein
VVSVVARNTPKAQNSVVKVIRFALRNPGRDVPKIEEEVMAVDYWHRVVGTGSPDHVIAFRDAMKRTTVRRLGGKTWQEDVSFSFQALYEIAPSARQVEPQVPYDPYDLSAWPVRRISARRAEVRYQFHTRNLEMIGLLQALSQSFPWLTFRLVTMCLDDSSVESYRLLRATTHRWIVPDKRQKAHWDRARKKFRLDGDSVYDDDGARHCAEMGILDEALDHWERGRRRHRRQWWNQEPERDLEIERELCLIELSEKLASRSRKRAKN